ncbi:prepilin-type N-terminal cleavage/methylation domain-containing protein [bacterium]|nr:prepilin-type N-terminal cleavage/methylation domain-containing protein [bacterium]
MRSSPSKRPSGFTLVEVLVGSAILALLLGSFVEIANQLRKQEGNAARLDKASAAADRLLCSWQSSKQAIPLHAQGSFPEEKDLTWRTEEIPSGISDDSLVLIRLTVFGSNSEKPIFTVHLWQSKDSSVVFEGETDDSATP